MRARFASFAASIVVAACSSSPSSDGQTDGGTDAVADANVDAPIEGGVCYDEAGLWIDGYKSCTSDADCATATHDIDCCGTLELVGVATSKLDAFEACEAAWSKATHLCGCVPLDTTTEDGKTPGDATPANVRCTNLTSSGGVCMSFAGP